MTKNGPQYDFDETWQDHLAEAAQDRPRQPQ